MNNQRVRELAAKANVGGADFGEGVRYYVCTEETFIAFTKQVAEECISWVNINVGMIDTDSKEGLLNHLGINDDQPKADS